VRKFFGQGQNLRCWEGQATSLGVAFAIRSGWKWLSKKRFETKAIQERSGKVRPHARIIFLFKSKKDAMGLLKSRQKIDLA